MGLIQNAKNLYIVDDRDSLKRYMNDSSRYWIRAGYTPSIEEVITDIMTNEDAITQTREEAMQAANKEWLEMLSVYEVANNIVNLVSFNLRDSFDESKRRGSKMRLTIKESAGNETFNFVVNFSPIQDLANKYKCNYILSSPKERGQNSATFDCETTNKSKADKYVTALDKAMQKKGYSCHILTKRDNGFKVIVDKNKNESLRRSRRIQEGFDVADDLQDIWDFVQEQEYDSAATSQNQLAGGVKAVAETLLEPGTINLDYGGGRYDKAVEYLKQFDVMNLVFDPFNRSKEHNREVLDIITEAGGADSCTCCNVLNVIDGDSAKITALKNMKRLVKSGGAIYIQTYEGSDKVEVQNDKGQTVRRASGVGKETTKGWQENKETKMYLPVVQKVFPDAKLKRIKGIPMIVCTA